MNTSQFKPLAHTMAVAALLASLAAPAAADDLSDARIIGIYSQVNSFDIETALLGQIKGNSEEVRALGEMVSGDHTGVRAAIHEIAGEIGVKPELPPGRIAAARDHDAVIIKLRGLEGKAFDAAYLQHEIAFHRAAIEAVETLLAPEADDEALRAHFEAVLPAFQHHLEANIEAAKKLGVAVAD